MIVIGVDAHKRTHTLVALDAVSGIIRSEATVQASDDGALSALRFAASMDAAPDTADRAHTQRNFEPCGKCLKCARRHRYSDSLSPLRLARCRLVGERKHSSARHRERVLATLPARWAERC